MEGGVEHDHLRGAWQPGSHGRDAVERHLVVQRRQWDQVLDLADHVVVDECRTREPGATVHHAVPDSDHVVERGAVDGEALEHQPDGLGVGDGSDGPGDRFLIE